MTRKTEKNAFLGVFGDFCHFWSKNCTLNFFQADSKKCRFLSKNRDFWGRKSSQPMEKGSFERV
jgi:hypothetical protein